MPENPQSASSRAVGILFACGLLIVFAGLAGLGATAISVASASGEGLAGRTAEHPARIGNGYGEAHSARLLATRNRLEGADTAVGAGKKRNSR